MPHPRIQKNNDVTANTIKFLERMLTQFFARQKPDSTHAKPRFMKNTSIAVTNTQTVSAHSFASDRNAAIGSVAAADSAAGSAASAASEGVVSSWAYAQLVESPTANALPTALVSNSHRIRTQSVASPI